MILRPERIAYTTSPPLTWPTQKKEREEKRGDQGVQTETAQLLLTAVIMWVFHSESANGPEALIGHVKTDSSFQMWAWEGGFDSSEANCRETTRIFHFHLN